jgi:hypothetical protein
MLQPMKITIDGKNIFKYAPALISGSDLWPYPIVSGKFYFLFQFSFLKHCIAPAMVLCCDIVLKIPYNVQYIYKLFTGNMLNAKNLQCPDFSKYKIGSAVSVLGYFSAWWSHTHRLQIFGNNSAFRSIKSHDTDKSISNFNIPTHAKILDPQKCRNFSCDLYSLKFMSVSMY